MVFVATRSPGRSRCALGADGDDLARRLVPHHERRDPAAGVAEIAVDVRPADADRVHAHEHVVRALERGDRRVDQRQVPLGIEQERAHRSGRRHHAPTSPRFQPPSTLSVCPVMYAPASDTSSRAAPARSSGTLDAAQRDRLDDLGVLDRIGEHRLGHLGAHASRRDRVDADAVGRPLGRERARELPDARLADRRRARRSRPSAGRRRRRC